MNSTVVKQIVQNLSFDVEAIPKTVELTTASEHTPLTVKIKVRKKDDLAMQRGIISIPAVNKNEERVPHKIRLVNSDQTIMSFDVFMEAEFEKKLKPRKNVFSILKPGICLGTPEDDDYSYKPSSSYSANVTTSVSSNRSDRVIKQNFTLSKNTYDVYSDKGGKTFLGKCKPGGCLDPPFGEDHYSYKPGTNQVPVIHKQHSLKKKNDDGAKFKERHSTVFESGIFKKKRKASDKSTDTQGSATLKESKSILELFQVESTVNSLSTTQSNTIITYPPVITTSELPLNNDKMLRTRISSDEKSGKSFNKYTDKYFMPPKLVNKEQDNKQIVEDETKISLKANNGGKLVVKNKISENSWKPVIPVPIPVLIPVPTKPVSASNKISAPETKEPQITPLIANKLSDFGDSSSRILGSKNDINNDVSLSQDTLPEHKLKTKALQKSSNPINAKFDMMNGFDMNKQEPLVHLDSAQQQKPFKMSSYEELSSKNNLQHDFDKHEILQDIDPYKQNVEHLKTLKEIRDEKPVTEIDSQYKIISFPETNPLNAATKESGNVKSDKNEIDIHENNKAEKNIYSPKPNLIKTVIRKSSEVDNEEKEINYSKNIKAKANLKSYEDSNSDKQILPTESTSVISLPKTHHLSSATIESSNVKSDESDIDIRKTNKAEKTISLPETNLIDTATKGKLKSEDKEIDNRIKINADSESYEDSSSDKQFLASESTSTISLPETNLINTTIKESGTIKFEEKIIGNINHIKANANLESYEDLSSDKQILLSEFTSIISLRETKPLNTAKIKSGNVKSDESDIDILKSNKAENIISLPETKLINTATKEKVNSEKEIDNRKNNNAYSESYKDLGLDKQILPLETTSIISLSETNALSSASKVSDKAKSDQSEIYIPKNNETKANLESYEDFSSYKHILPLESTSIKSFSKTYPLNTATKDSGKLKSEESEINILKRYKVKPNLESVLSLEDSSSIKQILPTESLVKYKKYHDMDNDKTIENAAANRHEFIKVTPIGNENNDNVSKGNDSYVSISSKICTTDDSNTNNLQQEQLKNSVDSKLYTNNTVLCTDIISYSRSSVNIDTDSKRLAGEEIIHDQNVIENENKYNEDINVWKAALRTGSDFVYSHDTSASNSIVQSHKDKRAMWPNKKSESLVPDTQMISKTFETENSKTLNGSDAVSNGSKSNAATSSVALPVPSNSTLKSILTKEAVTIDLGFHSYLNEKNERVFKTFDTTDEPERYSNDSISIIKSQVRLSANEIRVPIDTENDMFIQIKKSSPNQRVYLNGSGFEADIKGEMKLPQSVCDGGVMKSEFLHNTLTDIYDQELVPLQMMIKNLKDEIDMLASQQMKILNPKKCKPGRAIHSNRRCGCSKKT